MKSREEIRFLTLLAKTQDKTSKLKKVSPNPDENQQTDEDFSADEWRLPKVRKLKMVFINTDSLVAWASFLARITRFINYSFRYIYYFV